MGGGGSICAIISAVLATFSFANGMLIWPIGLILILSDGLMNKKLHYGKILLWLACSIIFISLYFYDFNYGILRRSITDNIIFLLTHPHNVIIPFLTYLGSPLSSYRQSIAIAAGALGLAAQIYSLFVVVKAKGWSKNISFWLGADLYVLLSAAVTAYGRSTSISAAMALRYLPANMLFWVVTPCLIFMALNTCKVTSVKWYVLTCAIILSLSVSEDALTRAREESEIRSLFLQQLERGQHDDKFFAQNVTGRNNAQLVYSLKKYGIRHFENAPDILFDDFRPIEITREAITHDAALKVEEFKPLSDDFFELSGWLQTEDSTTKRDMDNIKYSVLLYDDNNAFEADMDNVPEDRRHSTDAIFVRKNIYETFHRSFFNGNLYYGNLPEGSYNLAVKALYPNGDAKIFALDENITH